MMTNLDGSQVSFVPVFLAEGAESSPYEFKIVPGSPEEQVTGEESTSAALWAKVGAGDYQKLAVSPLEVGAYYGGSVNILVKVIAKNPAPGVSRSYLFLGVRSGLAAAWTD